MSQQEWNTHRKARQADYLQTMPIGRLADMEKPEWSPAEQKDARLQQLMQMDLMIAHGMAGLCKKGARSAQEGGPEGTFCHAEFLCDRWTGVAGVGEITRGHDDKLGGELHEIADDRAEKV